MALIFPKSTDKYVRLGALALVAAALGGVALAMYHRLPQSDHDRIPAAAARSLQPQTPCRRSRDGLLLLPLHGGQVRPRSSSCHGDLHELPTRVKPQSPRLEKVRESYAPANRRVGARSPDARLRVLQSSGARYRWRELRKLPRPYRPDGGSETGAAAEHGMVPRLPSQSRSEHPAGGAGDEPRMDPRSRSR